MNAHVVTADGVQSAIAIVTGVGVIVLFLVKWMLLPWLQTHIGSPLREVRRQVTVNGHMSDVPTLLDRVDNAATLAAESASLAADLRRVVDRAANVTQDNGTAVRALGVMLDGHLDRSDAEHGRLWEAIEVLREHETDRSLHRYNNRATDREDPS